VALFLFLSLGNPVPRDARDVIRENNVVSQSVPHGPDLTVDDRRGIESKWRRLQEIGLGAGLEAVLRTYAHEDRGTLQSIPPGQRKSLGHQGLLGLPLLAPERLANPLSAFKITKMRPVGEEAKEAEVTATDDVVTITFPMRRTEGGSVWDFAKGGVQFRTVTVPARTAPTPEQTGDELRRVMEFWRDYRRSLYADEDFDERLARYAPVERARLKTMPAAEREKAAAELQLGLPLVPADKLPEGLGTSSLANMSSSPEQHATLGAVTHIRVEITAGGRTLRFWLVTGIVGDEKAVYFDAAPVEVK
jgi:hypothetical protein